MAPASGLLWWTCQNVVVTAALAGVVWLACRALRVGPVGRHALWLIVLVKLLTPPLVVWPWAVHNPLGLGDLGGGGVQKQPIAMAPAVVVPPPATPVDPPAASEPPAQGATDVAVDAGDVIDGPVDPGVPSVVPATPPPPAAKSYPTSTSPVPPASPAPPASPPWMVRVLPRVLGAAGMAWALGAIAFGLVQGARIVRMHLWLRRSRPADGPLVERIADLARRLRMRPVRALLLDGIGSPMVWGLGRPVLLWPVELMSGIPAANGAACGLSETAVRGLIVHELAHVKRRDHWVGWLELLAGCLWWWNPLFWYVRHQLRENAELACDGWVVETLPKARRAYAEGLLAVCECLAGRRPRHNAGRNTGSRTGRAPDGEPDVSHNESPVVAGRPVPMPTVGVGTGGRRFIERRLAMILRDRVPLRLPRLGLAIVALLALTALPVFAQVEKAESESARDADPANVRRAKLELERAEYEREKVERALALRARETLDAGAAGRVAVVTSRRAYDGPSAPLPADAQEVVRQFQQQQEEAQREYQQKLARQRQEMIDELKKLQDKHTKAGELDEAVAIRDRIRQLQAGGGVTADMGGVRVGGAAIPFAPQPGPVNVTRARADPGTMLDFRDQVGQSFYFDVTGSTEGTVWGSDVYTDDSSVATAAVHAGLLRPGQRGIVRVTVLPGRDQYEGSTRNGVTTAAYAQWPGSYKFDSGEWVRGGGDREAVPAQPPQPDPGVLTNFRDKVGQTLAFEVTGSDQGTVWGTNPYTDDSPLAVAAVHAGVLRVGEKGVVRVTISPGRDSYTGTTHNGITSLPYGAWEGSYQFDLPARRRARIFDSGTGAPAGGGGFTPERNPGGPEIFRFQPSTDDLRSRRGQSFDVLVTGSTEGSVWGSDVYTDDSSLAAAAVHAGLLKNGETGIVRVTPLPGQDSYTPSNRNGVTSEAWQQWDGSFRVEKGEEGGKTDKTEQTEKTEKTDTILRTTGKNDTTEPRK